jgi:hypothetical protein
MAHVERLSRRHCREERGVALGLAGGQQMLLGSTNLLFPWDPPKRGSFRVSIQAVKLQGP